MSGGKAREVGKVYSRRKASRCEEEDHAWVAGDDVEICIYCGEHQEL